MGYTLGLVGMSLSIICKANSWGFRSSAAVGAGRCQMHSHITADSATTEAVRWMQAANSTMDEARALAATMAKDEMQRESVTGVAAWEQSNGRGTKGRAWVGMRGNLMLTVAIPYDRIPVPKHLTPLRVGVILAQAVKQRLDPLSSELVTLKWPNDVLTIPDQSCHAYHLLLNNPVTHTISFCATAPLILLFLLSKLQH
ncbi:unnamed protein product [Chrysoparadoxa australica]